MAIHGVGQLKYRVVHGASLASPLLLNLIPALLLAFGMATVTKVFDEMSTRREASGKATEFPVTVIIAT